MTVQYSGDNGAILFLNQKAVVKINGDKPTNQPCETAQGTQGDCSALSVLSSSSFAGTTFFHSLNMAFVLDSALWIVPSVLVSTVLWFSCPCCMDLLQVCLALCFKFQAPSIFWSNISI